MTAFNRGDLDGAVARYSNDHKLWKPYGVTTPKAGREAVRLGYLQLKKAFPDARLVSRRIVAGDGFVLVQGVLTGTHSGDYGRFRPTGRKVRLEFVRLSVTRGRELSESYEVANSFSIGRQLMGQDGASSEIAAPPNAPEIVQGGRDANGEESIRLRTAASARLDLRAVEALKADDYVDIQYGHGKVSKGRVGEDVELEAIVKMGCTKRYRLEHVYSAPGVIISLGAMMWRERRGLGQDFREAGDVEVHFFDIDRVRNGKVWESSNYVDEMEYFSRIEGHKKYWVAAKARGEARHEYDRGRVMSSGRLYLPSAGRGESREGVGRLTIYTPQSKLGRRVGVRELVRYVKAVQSVVLGTAPLTSVSKPFGIGFSCSRVGCCVEIGDTGSLSSSVRSRMMQGVLGVDPLKMAGGIADFEQEFVPVH